MEALLWIAGYVVAVFASTYMIARMGDANAAVATSWMWPVTLPIFILFWLAERGERHR